MIYVIKVRIKLVSHLFVHSSRQKRTSINRTSVHEASNHYNTTEAILELLIRLQANKWRKVILLDKVCLIVFLYRSK